MSQEKPHLVLFWLFDVPNYKLTCKIADDLEYEALEGGTLGYTKTYKGQVSHVDQFQWEATEKFWISENYGEQYGYFQPDPNRVKLHPEHNWEQKCINGFGPDGEYLDHMQRMQILLEGHDMAEIWGLVGKDYFYTPDKGLTIYKRVSTRDVNYPASMMEDPNAWWPEWPQACLMQPRTKGPRLSSYEDMAAVGVPDYIIEQCRAGQWASPLHPELQKWYIYPTK